MKVLVTGASGFCGKHLLRRIKGNCSYVIAGLGSSSAGAGAEHLSQYYCADIADPERLDAVIRAFRPDMVFHLAAVYGGALQSAVPAASRIYQVNFMGTVHLLEAIRAHAPDCRTLLVGSAAEYGIVERSPVREEFSCHPVNAYGTSKYAATMAGLEYARKYRLKVVVARPFNIVGSGMPEAMVAGALAARAKTALAQCPPSAVKVGDLDSKRDFVAVADVVDAYVRLIEGEFWHEVFNICSGQPCSIRDLGRMLLGYSPVPLRLEVDPSLFTRSPVVSFYGSYEKASQAFDYRPRTGLADALKAVWEGAAAS